MSNLCSNEVDQNYDAFCKQLPSFIIKHENKWALMRQREVVEFLDTFSDAIILGERIYPDKQFSVQQVTRGVIDLGWFSHALS